MEIEGEDGSKIKLKPDSKTVFGRGSGFPTKDRTVSRRHVLFEPKNPVSGTDTQTEARVLFEVLGKNPIWVRSNRNGGEIRVYRRFERSDVEAGDWFCVSGENPVWFSLKGSENELPESVDISNIDPVKEFGFLVIGHEFDQYPKRSICDIKHWDWFLEEPIKDSDDDEVLEEKGKRGMGKKRKKAEGNEDDDWTGESEDYKELIAKVRKVQTPNYSTRSKDREKPQKGASYGQHLGQRKFIRGKEEDNDEETLGGFVVDDDEVEPEEESDVDEEEEEESDVDDEEEE